jgi:hypothetical protein
MPTTRFFFVTGANGYAVPSCVLHWFQLVFWGRHILDRRNGQLRALISIKARCEVAQICWILVAGAYPD